MWAKRMTYIRKRDLYGEQRASVGTKCLKIINEWGIESSEQIFKGNIAALVMALISLIGRNKTDEFLKECIGEIPPPRTKPTLLIDNTRAVELPCDCGPSAA